MNNITNKKERKERILCNKVRLFGCKYSTLFFGGKHSFLNIFYKINNASNEEILHLVKYWPLRLLLK